MKFCDSGVETIGEIHVSSPNTDGFAAHFCRCESLKVAEGTFQGLVCFSHSGIKRIGKLITKRPIWETPEATAAEPAKRPIWETPEAIAAEAAKRPIWETPEAIATHLGPAM